MLISTNVLVFTNTPALDSSYLRLGLSELTSW